MTQNIASIWVYLAQTPLLWLTATLAVYLLAHEIYRRARFNPVPLSISLVV